jgi:phosphomannomutase
MLSVSGLRGLVDQSLTPEVARRYAVAVGTWLRQSTDVQAPRVVIGRDSRPSGAQYINAVAEGLCRTGCRPTLLGIASTPAVGVMVTKQGAQAGIVITASHNPAPWNGIKILRHDGVAPSADQASRIIDLFQSDAAAPEPPAEKPAINHDDTAVRTHVDQVLTHIDIELIRSRCAKMGVVVDSVHGAGGDEAAMLLDELGVRRVHLYQEPTGEFPHPPEPTAQNLTGLCSAVREHGAALGFAQDPDADRLAIVDDQGQYIGEEYTLVLAALRVMERHGKGGVAVANLSTSRMIDDLAGRFDVTVRRSPVGEANVAAVMQREEAIIGGEGNGGVMWPAVGYVRDSLVGMALVLELLADAGGSLSQLLNSIPTYAIVKDKLPIQSGTTESILRAVADAFADQQIDQQDGVRVDLADSWLHVRASNTEPIIRLIAEAPTAEAAQQLLDRARQVVDAAG